MKAYAGVGSRSTPRDTLLVMTRTASELARDGWTLRTGGADGADEAFRLGAIGRELYLPWPGFGAHLGIPSDGPGVFTRATPRANEIAQRFHPSWRTLSRGARMLHARNVHQVLGADCQSPSALVLCWTPDGAETTTTSKTGGTGQAIRIAVAHGVPVVNMARDGWEKRLEALL